jgi:hypothetical protein
MGIVRWGFQFWGTPAPGGGARVRPILKKIRFTFFTGSRLNIFHQGSNSKKSEYFFTFRLVEIRI